MSDSAWSTSGNKNIVSDWLIAPTKELRCNTNSTGFVTWASGAIPADGQYIYFADVRLTSGGNSAAANELDFRAVTGGTTSWPRMRFRLSDTTITQVPAGAAGHCIIDMSGGVYRVWMEVTVAGNTRLWVEVNGQNNASNYDWSNPQFREGSYSEAQIAAF